MKPICASLLLLFLHLQLYGQDERWTAFTDPATELIGFKDQNGNIQLPAKYMGFTTAYKLDAIMAVMEEIEGEYASYYLTKSGKSVGRDSLYVFDNGADCESEGYIRFQNKETRLVGLLNGEGEVVIPAIYSALTQAHNGMVVALMGAKKKYPHPKNHNGCNHYQWKGGKQVLLSTDNQVIIDDFSYSDEVSLHNVSIDTTQDQLDYETSTSTSFQGINSAYYSFINYPLEFKEWLASELLTGLSQDIFDAATFDKVIHWDESESWVSENKQAFLTRFYPRIETLLSSLNNDSTDYFVSMGGLNPFIFDSPEYRMYFNNCRQAKEAEYPVMTIVISHHFDNGFYQDHLEFLRTEEGYQLVSVSFGKE